MIAFRSRVLQADVWCTTRGTNNPARTLRTPSLKPSLVTLEDENQGSWNYGVEDPRLDVENLCRKRVELLKTEGITFADSTPLTRGRILLFYPQVTLVDGAACESSNGFFDNWNIPPWDTWISYSRLPDGLEVLYSWVPPEFLQLAEIGVSVNPEQCLRWLRDDEFLALVQPEME